MIEKEFLQLLDSKGIEYLVVGGYAVGYTPSASIFNKTRPSAATTFLSRRHGDTEERQLTCMELCVFVSVRHNLT